MNAVVTPTAAQAPEWFKAQRPSAKFAGAPDESLADGIGASYGVIGYKGKLWSLRLRGQNHIFLRPDDGTPSPYIDVVILRSASVKAKSYYPDGFEEGGSQGKRPTCASMDGVRPDSDVLQKQAEVCALCPHNQWRTDANGRKGRDCTDYKRLAVLLLPHQTVRLLGQAHLEPVFLRVPPDSLNDLAVFGETMNQQGWPYYSYITRISFDPQKAHPKFTFKAMQPLTDAEADTVLEKREDSLSKRITGDDHIEKFTALNGPAQSGATQLGNQTLGLPPIGGGPKDAPPRAPAVVVPTPPNPPMSLAADKQQAEAMTHLIGGQVGGSMSASAPVVDLVPSQGGAFGLAPPPEGQPATVAPVTQVPSDTSAVGAAVEDPDLDRKIAAMLEIS